MHDVPFFLASPTATIRAVAWFRHTTRPATVLAAARRVVLLRAVPCYNLHETTPDDAQHAIETFLTCGPGKAPFARR